MAHDVAQLIQNWLGDAAVKWEATPEVVDWARAYGTDLERAWAECPRADFLMAIAGACRAEPELVVRSACSVAREALMLVPAKHALPRQAVHLAETARAGSREIPEASPLIERTMALVSDLEGEAGRQRIAAKSEASQATKTLAQAALRVLSDTATRQHLEGARDAIAADQMSGEVLASTAAMLEGMLKEKAVMRFRDRTASGNRSLAAAHATRAAASSLMVATSHDLDVKCLVLIGTLMKQKQASDETLLDIDKAATIARRSRARIYSEAALVFEHAASAFGRIAAADERTWAAAITKVVTAMFYAAGGDPLDAGDRGALQAVLEAHAEQAKMAKLAEYAERVRAVIPASTLRPPTDEADCAAEAQRNPRSALLGPLTSLAPLARFLGYLDAAEAMETACHILRADGPLNRRALASALRTVHERTAAMFREHAGQVSGAEHEDARAATVSAEEAMREVSAVLAELGVEEPN